MANVPNEVVRQVNHSPKECFYFMTGRCKGIDGKQCDSVLELDHTIPRSKGGEDSASNCRLVCKNYNRSKNSKWDEKFTKKHSFFDYINEQNEIVILDKMRMPQKKVIQELRKNIDFFIENYNNLFNHALLFGLKVGTGKTLIMTLFVLYVNYYMRKKNKAGFRPNQRMLILCPERFIAHQIKNELSGVRKKGVTKMSELKEIFGINATPKVLLVEESGKEYTPNIVENYDIVVGCQQGLWGLSDTELRRLFYSFDVIVFDECHFATEQIRRLVSNAYGCLKLHFTSTPMDSNMNPFSQLNDGEFNEYYKLFYTATEDPKDRSHKVIEPLFKKDKTIEALEYRDRKELIPNELLRTMLNPNYICLNGGDSLLQKGHELVEDYDTKNRNNKIRLLNLTEKTKGLMTPNGHAMLITGSINKANNVGKILNDYAENSQSNDFKCIVSHSSSRKEYSLDNPLNPFNLAKYNNGILQPESCRFVALADQGSVGYNNPLLEVLTFCDTELSYVRLIQRIGRLVRWNDSINWMSQGKKEVLSIKIVWDSASDPDQKFLWRLYDAIEYIKNMDQWIQERFSSWLTIDPNYQGVKISTSVDPDPISGKLKTKLTEKAIKVIESFLENDNEFIAQKVLEEESLINGKEMWTQKWLLEDVIPSIRKGLDDEIKYPSEKTTSLVDELDTGKIDVDYIPPIPKDDNNEESDDNSLIQTKNNKLWSIPELVEPVSYCIKEETLSPTISELIDFVYGMSSYDEPTKDWIINRLIQNEPVAIQHHTDLYMTEKKAFESIAETAFGYDPQQLLGISQNGIPDELKGNTLMAQLKDKLIDAFADTIPFSKIEKSINYTFHKEMRKCLPIAGSVIFGLRSFGKTDPIYKQKSTEIAYAIFADPRKVGVADKIKKIAEALFVKRMFLKYNAMRGNYFRNKLAFDWIVEVVELRNEVLKNDKK